MGRQGVRSEWRHVPDAVRAELDARVGSPIVATRAVSGGFSPGPAVRAELADGRTVFVKAAGVQLNPVSPVLHRREGVVLRALPAGVPAPRLIAIVDDGDWVALAIEWVEGRMPSATDPDDVVRVLAVLDRVASATGGAAVAGVEALADAHGGLMGHWMRLAAEALPGLDEWSRRHLDRLATLDALAPAASAGTHLLHVDARTDNVVLAAERRRDVLVDWPAAALGAPWVDLVALLPALHVDGGPPPATVFDAHPHGRADPEAVDAFLASLAGYFTRQSLLPAPAGLPTLRAFQAAQGAVARGWLADRLRLH